MSWAIYILLCDQKTYYVGLTNDVDRRFNEHQSQYNIATKEFSDLQLVYVEQFKFRIQAEQREKQLKGWTFAKKKALVEGNLLKLKELSKTRSLPRGQRH